FLRLFRCTTGPLPEYPFQWYYGSYTCPLVCTSSTRQIRQRKYMIPGVCRGLICNLGALLPNTRSKARPNVRSSSELRASHLDRGATFGSEPRTGNTNDHVSN